MQTITSYGGLFVGPLEVSRLRDGISNELLAVFQDEMMFSEDVPASEYADLDSDEDFVTRWAFRASGGQILERLSALGVTRQATHFYLADSIASNIDMLQGFLTSEQFANDLSLKKDFEAELEVLKRQTPLSWIQGLRSSTNGGTNRQELGSQHWLLSRLDYWDERYALRAVLEAFPDAEVILDITESLGDLGVETFDLPSLASSALKAIRSDEEMQGPVVILTEGKTDSEFLTIALNLLYPHLEELVRVWNFDMKNEGSAGALVKTVKAFAAAGITNRIVALFDNDTAALASLRALDSISLPPNIQTRQYPPVDLARKYPTLGPPTLDNESGDIVLADVNGLAGSIELYLGRDVLTDDEGRLRPVQWRAFIAGPNTYQGEVLDKDIVHRAFRDKVQRVRDAEGKLDLGSEWNDLRAIVDAVLEAVDP